MSSITEKRLKWLEGIRYTVHVVEEITPEQASKAMGELGNLPFNHCHICGAFIIEHWFLKPNNETLFEERARGLRTFKMPFLIAGSECAPALLSGEELLKAEALRNKLQREKRYKRNLEKFKEIVQMCEELLALPNIDKTGAGAYFKSDKERVQNLIEKCKTGSFSSYHLGKLNWIRKRHGLSEINLAHFTTYVRKEK